MLNPSGYSIITDPGASRPLEHDTFTCAHCRFITFTSGGVGKPLQVAMIKSDGSVTLVDANFCRSCFQYHCPKPSCFECVPAMKKIEDEEKAARRLILP